MKKKIQATPARPRRRRARKSPGKREEENAQNQEFSEADLDALYDFQRRFNIPRALAAMARRRGACGVRPRDYYCCGVPSERSWLPHCEGKRANCPIARLYAEALAEPDLHPRAKKRQMDKLTRDQQIPKRAMRFF